MKHYLMVMEDDYVGDYPFYAGELITHEELKELVASDAEWAYEHSKQIDVDEKDTYFCFGKRFAIL